MGLPAPHPHSPFARVLWHCALWELLEARVESEGHGSCAAYIPLSRSLAKLGSRVGPGCRGGGGKALPPAWQENRS